MAAGQQRKRPASSNLHDRCKVKKKKRLESSDYILNLTSHVHLQWNDGQVVAKREQIGITWKDVSPYIDSVPKFHSGLADVFSFPKELFDLDNLMEVLSHEVWLTCLSESERKLLIQFLPSCAFPEEAVHSLLIGENLHFGNPFLKWSTLLCSSELHPDVLLLKEQQTRIRKKQYYLKINKYHTDMVAVLRRLKEKLVTCEDPEKLWRNLSTLKDCSKGVGAEKPNDYPTKELPLKMCNSYENADKYMAYIKINKKQFEMVKELKHSGDGIHSKFLSRVLGDISNYHIFPYETFEDEEKNKIREHWMQVTKDTSAAFEECHNRKLLKIQQMKCLEKELAVSRTLVHDKAKKSVLMSSLEDHGEVNRETERHSMAMTDEENSGFSSYSAHSHVLEPIPSCNQELNPSISNQETGNEDKRKPADNTRASLQTVDKMNSCQMDKEPKALIPPSKSTWIAVSGSDSCYQKPSETHLFSSYDVNLKHCQLVNGPPAAAIDLEREIMEQDAGLPLSPSFNVDTTQLLNSYSQSHNKVIPTFSVAQEMVSLHAYEHINDLRHPGLHCVMDDGSLRETDRFSLCQDNQRLVQERQASEKELYIQNIIDKIRYKDYIACHPSSKLRSPLQSSFPDGLGRHNWFSSEHQPRNGWSGIESSGSGGQTVNADGNFFSVLPEFSDLPSRSSFETSCSEHLLQAPNNVSMNLADPNMPTQVSNSTVRTTIPTPLDMMWMHYSNQDSNFEESIRKPFMKHWHQ